MLTLHAPALGVPSLNLTDAFADTKQILTGGGTANIVVLGDSLTYKASSYLPVFRSLMQDRYGNAGAGYKGFSIWTGAGFNDGWAATGLDADKAPHHSLDGLWDQNNTDPVQVTGVPNDAIYSVDTSSERVELHWVNAPNGGRFNLNQWNSGTQIPLGQFQTFSEDGSVETFDYTFPPGTQKKLQIVPRGEGYTTILGANNIIDAPGVRIHRGANGGWGVDNFLQRDYTFDEQLQLLDTDLVMVWLGANDQGEIAISYRAKMNDLVDRLQATVPDAEIVLISSYQSSDKIGELAFGMELSAMDQNIGFINLYETAGDKEFFETNGYLADQIHFSQAGGQYMGQFLFDVFETNGASLVPEPATLTLAAAGALVLLRRPQRR
jgi:hypothetical protein